MRRLACYALNTIYLLALMVISPWLLFRSLRTGRYREGLREKLLGTVPNREGERTCLWFHAVSLGEVNLIAPVVEAIRTMDPTIELAISTTTMSGFQVARKRFATDRVFYAPLDFSWAVRTAIRRLNPSVIVLAELEVWPNLILAAEEAGVPLGIVNGRLSDSSYRGYRRFQRIFRALFARLAFVGTQDDSTSARFVDLGVPAARVQTTGSIKYDGAETNRDNSRTVALRSFAGITAEDVIFLAGSTQEPEESITIQTYVELAGESPHLKLILVPRHPHRFREVEQLLQESGLRWLKRSQLEAEEPQCDWQVLLVDVVGELAAWWGTADIGFVGGSLGDRGGQNMIEPAAYGVAVSFGPNTRNFRKVVESLLEAGAAVVVGQQGELTDFVRRCLKDPGWARELGGRARQLVHSHRGATDKTLELLGPWLQRSNSNASAA